MNPDKVFLSVAAIFTNNAQSEIAYSIDANGPQMNLNPSKRILMVLLLPRARQSSHVMSMAQPVPPPTF